MLEVKSIRRQGYAQFINRSFTKKFKIPEKVQKRLPTQHEAGALFREEFVKFSSPDLRMTLGAKKQQSAKDYGKHNLNIAGMSITHRLL